MRNQGNLTFEPRVKISGSKIIHFTQTHGMSRRVKPGSTGKAEEKEPRPYSLFAEKSRKRLKENLDRWINTVEYATTLMRIKEVTPLKRHTFITLTLSSTQIHCDKKINRELLNKFLIKAKRKWGVKNFIWKAEVQVNGNIHYHILTDRYIGHESLRLEWNNIQESLGYISRFEKKHHHRNPNSTDIHSLKKIKNVTAYIGKYMSKSETVRPLCGRTWGRSNSIHNLQAYIFYETYDLYNWFDMMDASVENRQYQGERFKVTIFGKKLNMRTLPGTTMENLKAITRANLKALHN